MNPFNFFSVPGYLYFAIRWLFELIPFVIFPQ